MSDPKPQGEIDELLDRAYQALIAGDRSTADVLAGQVLAIDRDNAEAEDLLAAPTEQGQIRRLTILFADLVESTELSNRVELETYRIVVGRYREEVRRIVDHYEGHIASIKGDGLLAVFGHPNPHEDDARRAVQAGLDLTGEVARLNEQTQRRFGVSIQVRIGVHRGLVYLDTAQDDVYGFAANLASRLCGLAEPGTVVVSDGIARLIRGTFENHSERRADLNAAVELARQQGATIFELRAAADDFELNGETARLALNDAVNRFPSDSTWPELIRAQALLRGPVP